MKKCVSVFLAALMLSLVSCSEKPYTVPWQTDTDTESKTDTAYIQGKSGNKYTVDDEYTLSVPTYKYVFFANDEKKETGKRYLIVDLEYKNLETKSIILKDRISSKAIYQNKYEYDLDIYANGGFDSGIAFVLENDNIVNCYHEIREDYDLEPLESVEFNYVYRLPEEYDGSDITVHMNVANDEYDFTFEKNENHTALAEEYIK